MKRFTVFLILILFMLSGCKQFLLEETGSGPPALPQSAVRAKTDVSNFDNNLSSADTTVQAALETLDEVTGVGDSTETNQDDAWAAVTGGTETLITVTYQDATDDVDFVVENDLNLYDWTNVDGTDLKTGSVTQAYDAGLLSIAGLTTLADRMIYTTASDTYAVTTLSAFARTVIDDADAAAVRTTIGAQATVTEGSLTDDVIVEADLKAVDAAADEDIFTYESTTGDFEWHSLAEVKAAMSLDSVENTALSTWAGTSNITTLGTIGTGVWQGTVIANTYIATDLEATNLDTSLTFADGDQIDLSAITYVNAATTNEGLALPAYIAGAAPADNKSYVAYDAANDRIMVYESTGWKDTSSGAGAPAAAHYIVTGVDGTLSDESLFTDGYAIDSTDTGGDDATFTVAFDPTEFSADGTDTWSDGSQASVAWTINTSGANDNVITFTDGLTTFNDAVTVTDTLTASAGIAVGASQSITGTTALTLGGGSETIAINSSDWDIDATGAMTGIGAITSDGVVTATGFTIGAAVILQDELEILDGATLSTADINIIDGVSDSGTLTAAELLYVDGVTSAIQTQLDARCLESVFGDAIEADDLELSGTTLQLAAEIPHIDAAQNISADWEWQDNIAASFGNDNDWERAYDTDISDNDSDFTTALTGAGLVFETTNAAADAKVIFNNTDATYGVDLYVKDIIYSGSLIFDGTGDSYLSLSNNASYAGDNYELFVEGTVWKFTAGDTTEKTILNTHDAITMDSAATSVNFSALTNFEIPNSNTATADAEGEIAIDTDDDQIQVYVGGTQVVMDFTSDAANYVLKSDGGGTFTMQADATGGTTPWDAIGDPTGANSIAIDGAGETTTFAVTADNTEFLFDFDAAFTTAASPDLFRISQNTTGTQAVTLFKVDASDSDVIVAEIGNTTDYWQISQPGVLSNVSGATIDIAAPSDLLIESAQIDYDDMAGSAVVATTGGIDCDEDVDIDFDAADEEIAIGQAAVAGTEDVPLIGINDDRTGATASEVTEATIWIDAEGVYALAAVDGAIAAEGGFVPTAADGASLGSADFEISDIYLAASGVIYGENDQSNTLTSSATGWTMNLDLTVTGGDIVLGTTSIFSGGDTASLNNIDAIDATTEATIEAAIDTLANLSAGGLADDSVQADDIDTLNAGRSMTWDATNDEVDADAELYTHTECIYIEDPTADDDLQSIYRNSTANDFTITEIWAESDQTVNFDLQIDDGTPADVNGTDISPAAGEAEDTSLSGDTTLGVDEELDLAVTSVSGTPTWCSICWTYTVND